MGIRAVTVRLPSGSSVMDGTLVACNSAGEGGGGIAAYQNELVGCVISNNVAWRGGGAQNADGKFVDAQDPSG